MMAQRPLPVIPPGAVDPAFMTTEESTNQALVVLKKFNAALVADNAKELGDCFFPSQAYWKDVLALTYHMRTFTTAEAIVSAFLHTKSSRGIDGEIKLEEAQFIPATSTLQFINCWLSFKTTSPAAFCSGRVLLLPINRDGSKEIEWKIWILSTILENFDLHLEDENQFRSPSRQLEGLSDIETDVFIIGGGNAAAALAARLKALGVESIMAERNPRPGDNWALRYDSMRFHIPTSFCELPYMSYDKSLQSPHLLTRDELAEHLRRYIESFNLNIVTSAQIQSTQYGQSTKQWTVRFQTPTGKCTVICKHLVQATGIASQKPYIPDLQNGGLYEGINVHSAQYRNADEFREKGVKSALVIGSANTAFDVLEDCHSAGLKATMVVRSQTYIVPVDYVCHKASLGLYDFGVNAADKFILTLPTVVDSQIGRDLFATLASKEPNRYDALAKAGFPVADSRDPDSVLMQNLIERAGGHYVDVGGTKLIAEGRANVKAGVEPVAYTKTGLSFSDGSTVDADVIIWCTGFADKDARSTAAQILGGGHFVYERDLLGPQEIAARLDATWGVDSEGEIRGMWKRHLRIDNYWIMGGHTQQHRWHSRTLALQIKAALEGILPPPYREVPVQNA
ncbi:hypothetical protein Plec18167_001165 [Paecilomyces lecythidis]|uniref:Uncharacterized protein n=1 Tax=Paecilomyces lecythidis TaxID=3004212 RepID=A0ABR3YBI5_9EURO